MSDFLSYIEKKNPDYFDTLDKAGGVTSAKGGSTEFVDAWQALAKSDPDGFRQIQYDFIYDTKYMKALYYIEKVFSDFDLNSYSAAMKDVIWSISVQHGMSKRVISDALKNQDCTNMPEADIINRLYDSRIYHVENRTSMTLKEKQEQLNRYANERENALKMIK